MVADMNRRTFLKGAVSAAGAAALCTQAAGMVRFAGAEEAVQPTEEQIVVEQTIECDVVIIGAGMSGLCAALAVRRPVSTSH